MTSKTVMLFVLFVILTWVGSAGIALGMVELSGGGEQGIQGEQGPRGERGASGPAGEAATSLTEPCSGFSNAELWADIFRLSRMYAVTSLLDSGDYTSIDSGHPQAQACVDFIMSGEGSFVECGFQRAE